MPSDAVARALGVGTGSWGGRGGGEAIAEECVSSLGARKFAATSQVARELLRGAQLTTVAQRGRAGRGFFAFPDGGHAHA